TVRARLEQREERFLAAARQNIFGARSSFYRDLLGIAGCERGDFEQLISRDGLEAGLRALYRQGVYLSVDELKGRKPVVRGSSSVPLGPDDLQNPTMPAQVSVSTGGSTGTGTFVPMDLRFLRDISANQCLRIESRGGVGRLQLGYWGVPGGG